MLIIFASLIPAWYLNRWLQKIIQPKKSFVHFLFYMLAVFVFLFVYTFLVTFIIFKLFPPPQR